MNAEYRNYAPLRDYYTEFIEGSRWLKKEQAEARTAWFENLSWEQKEKTFFKFEMLLKGLVCFGNPVNQPGPSHREGSLVGKSFDSELGIVQAAIIDILDTGRQLYGERDNSVVFQRYLESLVVQDHARIQMAKKSLDQDTPQQSLSLMLSAMENLKEIVEGLSSVQAVSFQLFTSVIKIAQREIHRSDYFDPLASLEFRAEFDRIKIPRLLKVISSIESEPSRRVAALVFLALFRLLRYLDLIGEERADNADLGSVFVLLAVLRSDAWALADFLKRDAATWISEGFGRLYEDMNPQKINEGFATFNREFKALKGLRELLGSTGNQLDLEIRKAFEQQLPVLDGTEDKEQMGEAVDKASSTLQSFLQNAVVLMTREFAPSIEGDRLFDNFISEKACSERLRREIWMFQQILRAFVEKAKGSAAATDQWAGMNSFRFVKEFVTYFKSMGYQLLRYSDYSKFDRFMTLIDRLRDGDVLEVQRLYHIVESCEEFNLFLAEMFDAVSQREELKDVDFDKRDAAKTLKLFLGH